MPDKNDLLTFPCDFSIKIIGLNQDDFLSSIIAIIKQHYPHSTQDNIRKKESTQDKYLAITATVYALEKETLDALYRDLTRHPLVKWVL